MEGGNLRGQYPGPQNLAGSHNALEEVVPDQECGLEAVQEWQASLGYHRS